MSTLIVIIKKKTKKIQAEACIIILVGMTGIEPVRDLTPAGF